jgi:hypothetical protein
VLFPADFSMLKETVTQQKVEAEAQLSALDAETATMQSLLEETQNNIVDLVTAPWKRAAAAGTGFQPVSRWFGVQS